MKASIMAKDARLIERVFTERQLKQISDLLSEDVRVIECDYAEGGDEEFIFSTWGMPKVNLSGYRNLKAVFYAAGSVQTFAREMLENGIRVFSAWHANAVPVAEMTFAQILLSMKGYLPVMHACRKDRARSWEIFSNYPGGFRTKVGLLGLGAIGSRVAEMLKGTDAEVYAFDPFSGPEKAEKLHVRLASMEEIFKSCVVISNHIANLPETQGIIKREHLMSMPSYSTFINTGRGAQLSEQDLYDALSMDPTRSALLDVVTDERHFENCVLRSLPNCYFTPHIAGTAGLETERMGQYMVDSFSRFLKHEPSPDEVTLTMLETMA